MTTLEAIRAELVDDATLTGLVADRIYPQVAEQGTAFPAVVLTIITDTPENSLDGSPLTRLVAARVQVDCYAKTYVSAHAVADAVDAIVAALSAPTLAGWRVAKRDIYEDETQLHRVVLEFVVHR
jgi:hypothetical protein